MSDSVKHRGETTCCSTLCSQVGFELVGDESPYHERKPFQGRWVFLSINTTLKGNGFIFMKNVSGVFFEDIWNEHHFCFVCRVDILFLCQSLSPCHTPFFLSCLYFPLFLLIYRPPLHPQPIPSLVTASITLSVPQWETLPSLSFSLFAGSLWILYRHCGRLWGRALVLDLQSIPIMLG